MTDKLRVTQKTTHTIKLTAEQLARIVGDRIGVPAGDVVELTDEDRTPFYADFLVRWYSEAEAPL